MAESVALSAIKLHQACAEGDYEILEKILDDKTSANIVRVVVVGCLAHSVGAYFFGIAGWHHSTSRCCKRQSS
jgi:hypothetical protein